MFSEHDIWGPWVFRAANVNEREQYGLVAIMERSDMNNTDTDRIIAERFGSLSADGDDPAAWQPSLSAGLARLNEQRAVRRARIRGRAVLASVIAAACVPIMAFPVTRAFAAHCVSACVTGTSAVREFLLGSVPGPPRSTTYVKPEDRRMAPDFTLTDASGQPVRLSDSRGKVVLLNFWATWCAPCEQEIPWFIDFQRSKQALGLSVIGVSMDDGGWAAVKPYIENHHVNYTVTIGNEEVAALFAGPHPAVPLTLIVDRTGRIAAIHAGLCSRTEYESDIDAVLNER
jgi:peroxiredoxin